MIKRFSIVFFLLSSLLASIVSYALPFTIVPTVVLPTTVPVNDTVFAYYTVTNNTSTQRNNNHVKYLPPNVTQVTSGGLYANTCGATFNLAGQGHAGDSCILQLAISGAVNGNDPDPQHHLFVCFPSDKTCAGTTASLNVNQTAIPKLSLEYYQNWVNNLVSQRYLTAQGSVFLMTNNECPSFVAVFNSCFGQNPASPYIIPEPPIGNSTVGPYAQPFTHKGPSGPTNMFYRLSDNDAMITIVSYPPFAAYFGYQSYVFSSETSNYTGITPPPAPSRVFAPNTENTRYEIFGSLGNDINNVITQNNYTVPWGGKVVMYITTSNLSLANALIANASEYGITPQSIFVESIGSNVITGTGSAADDMVTLMRYAVPQSQSAADAWTNAYSSNVLVYKVTNANINVLRYGANQYTPHITNNSETSLTTALSQLKDILQAYLETHQPATVGKSEQTIATTTYNSDGVPVSGLVGNYCIFYGVNCEGDNQDTSTYASLVSGGIPVALLMGPEETAFIAGVNHSVLNLNNNHYISLDIYNGSNSSGVASSSQTNPTAAGFDSGILTGSAQAVLEALDLWTSAPITVKTAAPSLYVTFVTRNCNNPIASLASIYCINLMGSTLIPLTSPITITERSYLMPGTTTGGLASQMVYPFVIAGTHNFVVG